MDEQEVTPKVVEAVGIATRTHGKTNRGKAVELAVAQAILDANAEGIPVTDTEKIRERMQTARQRVLDEFYQAELEAAERLKAQAEG